MTELTLKQKAALLGIRQLTESRGCPPTLRELCEHLQYKAVGSAQDMVRLLRRKGYLMEPGTQRARSLIISDLGRTFDRPGEVLADEDKQITIPCLGQIPAGNPLQAIEERIGVLTISASLVGKQGRAPGRLFALQAQGQSMIGAGIFDGDWLVVRSVKEADKGDVVVARMEDDATVKRLARDRKGWFLKPENPDFQPIYARDRPFEVIGKVLALQRSLI